MLHIGLIGLKKSNLRKSVAHCWWTHWSHPLYSRKTVGKVTAKTSRNNFATKLSISCVQKSWECTRLGNNRPWLADRQPLHSPIAYNFYSTLHWYHSANFEHTPSEQDLIYIALYKCVIIYNNIHWKFCEKILYNYLTIFLWHQKHGLEILVRFAYN